MRTISMILMKERTSMEQVFQYVDQMFEQYVKEVATLCSFRSVKGDSARAAGVPKLTEEKALMPSASVPENTAGCRKRRCCTDTGE